MSGGEAILGARCDDQGIGRNSLLRLGCEVGLNSKCCKAGRKGPVKYWEFCMAGEKAAVWLKYMEVWRAATSAMVLDCG